MEPKQRLVLDIQECVRESRYRIRLHAVRHMVEEGFDEDNLREAISGSVQVLEEYPEDARCLLLGYFHFTPSARSPLHIVCDLSVVGVVDIVTAYIPQRPWWTSATKRGNR